MSVNGRAAAVAVMAEWSRTRVHVLPPDGIGVQGHCVGAVGRAFLGHSAGFESASIWAARAKAAGILRTGAAELGDIVVWTGGSHGYGHVGIATGPLRFWGVDRPTPNEVGLSTIAGVWTSLTYAGRIRPEDMYRIGWPVIPGGVTAPASVPLPVVTLHDLTSGESSKGAALINRALAAEGFLAKLLIRDHVGAAASTAFRVYRWRRGYGLDSLRALRALGRAHGFTVG